MPRWLVDDLVRLVFLALAEAVVAILRRTGF
jgi:hypothetical protein